MQMCSPGADGLADVVVVVGLGPHAPHQHRQEGVRHHAAPGSSMPVERTFVRKILKSLYVVHQQRLGPSIRRPPT